MTELREKPDYPKLTYPIRLVRVGDLWRFTDTGSFLLVLVVQRRRHRWRIEWLDLKRRAEHVSGYNIKDLMLHEETICVREGKEIDLSKWKAGHQ